MAGQPERESNQETLASVLGLVPSGLFILTAGDGEGRETGMLASWVMQAAFDPPSLTMAVNRKRYLTEWLSKSPQVVLNLLGEKQTDMLKHFGRGFEPDADAFEGLATTQAANGVTALSDCLGYLAGRVTDTLAAGDHLVYLVEVTDAAHGSRFGEETPYVHIRKDGLKY